MSTIAPKLGDTVVFYKNGTQVEALVTHVYNDNNPESPLDLETSDQLLLGVPYQPGEQHSWGWKSNVRPKSPEKEFDLDHLFSYHPPDENTVSNHEAIKAGARAFVEVILANAPDSVDRNTAIRQVREAMYSAAAAVALGGRIYK